MSGSRLVTIAVQMCLIFGCELWPKAPGKFWNWTGKLLENSGSFFFQKSGNPVSMASEGQCNGNLMSPSLRSWLADQEVVRRVGHFH